MKSVGHFLSQYQRVIVFGVFRRVYQRNYVGGCAGAHIAHARLLFGRAQFHLIVLAELLPILDFMAEPRSQRRSRGQVFAPEIEFEFLLRQPARPQSVDEYAIRSAERTSELQSLMRIS